MIHFYDTFIISPENQFVWILELFDIYVINPPHDLKSNKKIHYRNSLYECAAIYCFDLINDYPLQ